MQHLIEVSSKISANILVTTTCIVMIYGVFLLAHLMEKTFRGEKIVKTKLRWGQQEVVLEEEKVPLPKRFNWHKIFWILVGCAYGIGFGLAFLPLILFFLAIYAIVKIVIKIKMMVSS